MTIESEVDSDECISSSSLDVPEHMNEDSSVELISLKSNALNATCVSSNLEECINSIILEDSVEQGVIARERTLFVEPKVNAGTLSCHSKVEGKKLNLHDVELLATINVSTTNDQFVFIKEKFSPLEEHKLRIVHDLFEERGNRNDDIASIGSETINRASMQKLLP